MTIAALRDVFARLNVSAGVLTVLGSAIDSRLTGRAFGPAVTPHVDAVLDALGVRTFVAELSAQELQPVLAEIRLTIRQGDMLLYGATRAAGWAFTDPDILQAAGDTSAGFAGALKQMIAPRLAGLVERLDGGGSFLDVGVGVAGLSIAMARLWPTIRVLGVDVWEPSLDIARENVRGAALADRIELRQQSAQNLTDMDAFDLAWVPAVFIPSDTIAAVVGRVRSALRPGGWMLFAMAGPGTDPVAGSFARLRTALWGGTLLAQADAEALLQGAGYTDVQAMPGPPSATVALVAGRRAAD